MVVFLVYLLLVRVERIDPTSVQAQFVTLSSCVMYLHTYIYKLISLIKRCDLMNLAQSLYVVSLFQNFHIEHQLKNVLSALRWGSSQLIL